ncbi:SNX16 [Lepeophtheirus salmonis]|uniref:SNX16 n=1 Tax=Lepeophtheirus salmonis TaxID=72036 RepID=A0A7R8CWS0_LEPSM|nr:SNX16 [Lepeophtheirus salmonis]CAF2954627.1 SNX16 [Lepeophtheirus salmonis]
MDSKFGDSENSLYKSAPSSEGSEGSWCLDEKEHFQRPPFVCGSECSFSNSHDENDFLDNQSVTMRSSINYLACKLNITKALPFRDILSFESANHLPECPFSAQIIGYEIIPGDPKFTAYKIRVRQNEKWSTSELLSWMVFRRYNDFLKLYKQIKREVVIKGVKLPGKSWFGDNFHPHFIGQRIIGLQLVMNQLLVYHDNQNIRNFFCIDDPPTPTTFKHPESYHLIFTSHQETVRELREQLRQKDQLIQLTENLKDILQQKDSEVEYLRSEMETLRKQKDTLMKAFSSSIEDLTASGGGNNNCLNIYPRKPSVIQGSYTDENFSIESMD